MSRWHPLPAELYALAEQSPATVLLESGRDAQASPSRFFTAPLRILQAHQPSEIPLLFAEIESAVAAGHLAAGFFTYECGSFFEPTAAQRPARPNQPLAWFGIYDRCYCFDHTTGQFHDGVPPGLAQIAPEALENQPKADLECRFGLSEEEYGRRIDAVHGWIRSGDIYQLNFTVPMRIQTTEHPAALYRRLRERQPVAYGAFLHWEPGRRVLSFSPELFFRLEENETVRRILTRPMKGTAPRGRTTAEDQAQATWLCNDPKNRAENVMIVDLLRNDLGRICEFGSVRAEELFAVERFPTLWQMTSTVSGAVRPEVGFEEVFRALFPCGSITGAPKVRAMQLAAMLEDDPRGVYTGAIGFFSREKTVFSVAIRTLELEEKDGIHAGKMGVGSGIVIDSDANEEFRECAWKAAFLTDSAPPSISTFCLIETLLWNGDYPFLAFHLDRLLDSASYFDFRGSREEASAALRTHARGFSDQQPRKVRLLLDREGRLRLESTILPEASAEPLRLRLSVQRTDPNDRMLFHKTTHRPLYAAASQQALAGGFDDMLFLNRREEVTESAIANLFVEKDGRWFTPPVSCGLLAGVFRRHLLKTRPEIEERVLLLQDLREADALYLGNAVRGLRRAILDEGTL